MVRGIHRDDRRVIVLATAGVLAAAVPSGAATWSVLAGGDASGAWNVSGNWNSGAGPVPDAQDQIADFSTQNITVDSVVTLDGDRIVGQLKFGDTTTSSNAGWSIGVGSVSTSKLTLSTATGKPIINVGTLGQLVDNRLNKAATISTPIVATNGFTKSGAGTLTLSGTNTSLAGGITVDAGRVNITTIDSIGTGAITLNGGGFLGNFNFSSTPLIVSANSTIYLGTSTATRFSTLTIGGSILTLASDTSVQAGFGSTTINGLTTVAGNATIRGSSGGASSSGGGFTLNGLTVADTLLNGNPTPGNTTYTVTLDHTAGASNRTRTYTAGGTLSDNASDATKRLAIATGSYNGMVVKLTGTANTYTGPTTVNGSAIMEVSLLADGGAVSSIGKSTNAASNLVLNGGTFKYVGTSASESDRLFTMGGSVAISASATNAGHTLTFDNTGSVVQSGSGTRTLTLNGTNTGSNTFGLSLGNNGANAVGLTKLEAGTWVLTGDHTYTGVTTVSLGKLTLASTGELATSNIVVNGGTLDGAGKIHYLVSSAASTPIQVTAGKLDISALTLDVNMTTPTLDEYVLVNVPVGSPLLTGSTFGNVLNLPAGWTVDYDGTAANPNAIVAVVPEPASMAFAGVALGLVLRRRHRTMQ